MPLNPSELGALHQQGVALQSALALIRKLASSTRADEDSDAESPAEQELKNFIIEARSLLARLPQC